MAARHRMKKAKGGEVYSGAGSNVVKEADEKKHGGAVKHMGKMSGEKSKHRMDKKPRRAHGGRVGSDKAPFSSAANPKMKSES